jgi:hypothetical protein
VSLLLLQLLILFILLWGLLLFPQWGSQDIVIFVDDFSRYTWIYLMKNRSKVLTIYIDFAKMIQTQYSKAIKVFYSDNVREYRQTDFFTILKHYGTIFHTSCAGTSQQNGGAERKLRHILDTVRALTNATSTPVSFWGEAALTAVYTINRCLSLIIQNTTQYKRLFGTAPNYSLLKVFGYVCFVLLQPHEHTKLQPRSQLYCFLGYGLEENGYRCYDPVAKRLQVSRHVVFWEYKMFYSLPLFSTGNSDSQADPLPDLFPDIPSPSTESVNPISDESPLADPTSDESLTADPTFDESPLSAPTANHVNTTAPEPRRSHRVNTLPSHLVAFIAFLPLTPFVKPPLTLYGSKL